MTTATPTSRLHARLAGGLALAVLLMVTVAGPPASASALSLVPHSSLSAAGWQWPVAPPVSVTAPYVQPEHDYAPGHRGIDVSDADGQVFAPMSGTIAWVGTVADRPLLTINHGNGYVSTLEPVVANVDIGNVVRAGDQVGTLTTGGHTPVGSVHWGVRVDGEYVNPASLLRRITRPILLPCCED